MKQRLGSGMSSGLMNALCNLKVTEDFAAEKMENYHETSHGNYTKK